MSVSTKTARAAVTHRFPETKWAEISSHVARAFRMEPDEEQRFRNKNIAKLIASLPFLARCEDAERTSVTHLGTYILSVRETKRYFNAQPHDSESVFERLRLVNCFKGGDSEIIERGMSLLALNMVSDYRRDAAEDVFLQKFNPVSAGDFDFQSLTADLKRRIESIQCPEMDEIMALEAGPDSWWGF